MQSLAEKASFRSPVPFRLSETWSLNGIASPCYRSKTSPGPYLNPRRKGCLRDRSETSGWTVCETNHGGNTPLPPLLLLLPFQRRGVLLLGADGDHATQGGGGGAASVKVGTHCQTTTPIFQSCQPLRFL